MLRTLMFLLSAPVLLLASACLYLMALGPEQQALVKQAILAKIPLVNQFVTVQTPTRLFDVKARDVALLKTEAFSVDYLVDLALPDGRGGEKRYLALYPFVVESVLDLRRASVRDEGERRIVSYPAPTILPAGQDNSKDNLILRSTLELGDAGWEKYLKPIKVALHRKAEVEALRSGILTKAHARSLKELQRLAPSSTTISIAQPGTAQVQRLATPHLGMASYVQQAEKLAISPANNRFDGVILKEGNLVGGVKFVGYNQQDRFGGSRELAFRFFDTTHPTGKTTRILLHDDDTVDADILIRGRHYSYSNSGYDSASQKFNREIKHILIGLAINTLPEPNTGEDAYCTYRDHTIKAAHYLVNGQYAQAAIHIDEANRHDADSYTSKVLSEAYAYFGKDQPMKTHGLLAAASTVLLGVNSKENFGLVDDAAVSTLTELRPGLTQAVDYLLAYRGTALANARQSVAQANQRLVEEATLVSKQTFVGFSQSQRAQYLQNSLGNFKRQYKERHKAAIRDRNPQNNLWTYDEKFVSVPHVYYDQNFGRTYILERKKREQDILDLAYGHGMPRSVSAVIFLKLPRGFDTGTIYDKYSAIGLDADRWHVIPDIEETGDDKDGRCYALSYASTNLAGDMVNLQNLALKRSYGNMLFVQLMDRMKKIFQPEHTAKAMYDKIEQQAIRETILFLCE